jgi:hypothetical protein
VSCENDSYCTRSAAVARFAACLRSVGYRIEHIRTWNGTEPQPALHKGVILVTDGSSSTDTFMNEQQFQGISIDLMTHYRASTVGAMLWNSFPGGSENVPELFQQDFDNINDHIKESLSFSWAFVDVDQEEVQAHPLWNQPEQQKEDHIATRLATILFGDSGHILSNLYKDIASDKYLKVVLEYTKTRNQLGKVPKPVHRFQVISAIICLAVLGRLGGTDFWNIQHSTMLDLSSMDHLRWLCSEVGAILAGDCSVSRIITALATVHCAVPIPIEGLRTYTDDNKDQSTVDTVIVGWRRGRYSVLPNLLFSLSKPLSFAVLDLQCVDEFIANLPVRPNGSIHSSVALHGPVRFSSEFLSQVGQSEDIDQLQLSTRDDSPINFGPPTARLQDKPLYINIERSPIEINANAPAVSLCGRLDGETVGHVGIQDVLTTLALSWSDAQGYPFPFCSENSLCRSRDSPGSLSADQVYNISATRFCRDRGITPRCPTDRDPRHHVYVQVAGNTPWTVFLAGADKVHNRVCFKCPHCAVKTGANYVSNTSGGLWTIIGYA